MIDIIEIEPGWLNLERHLETYHGVGDHTLQDLDSDDLRRLHAARHASATFVPGREHGHYS